jgi:hypothetical protein
MVDRFLAALAPFAISSLIGCGGRTTMGWQDLDGSAGGAGGGGNFEDAPTACTSGTVTFHMRTADGRNASHCVGLGCTEEWVAVRTPQGARVPLNLGCNTTCEACRPVACPLICIAPKHMRPEGERLTWDGTYWADANCGTEKHLCRTKRCVSPGKYIARMCAAESASDAGQFCVVTGSEKCVELEFDYPSAAVVEGAI